MGDQSGMRGGILCEKKKNPREQDDNKVVTKGSRVVRSLSSSPKPCPSLLFFLSWTPQLDIFASS